MAPNPASPPTLEQIGPFFFDPAEAVRLLHGAATAGWQRTALGLGANIGGEAVVIETLREVARRLPRALAGWRLLAASSLYRSAPWGDVEQAPFVNAVLLGELPPGLAPDAVLPGLKALEAALGRTPTRRWGPRVIDIDLLEMGAWRWLTQALQVPHPGIHPREFVRVPLTEAAQQIGAPPRF